MDYRMVIRGWRVALVGLVTVTLLVSWQLSPVASAGVGTPRAAAADNTYGGLTSQGMPMFVEMNATRRQVVRTSAAIALNCTSGNSVVIPDRYTKLPVSRAGKFRVAYGPVTVRNDDGTTTDVTARVNGALNDTKTRITGVWRIIVTEHDVAGVVTDTCDSGLRSWKAKQ